MNRLLFAAVAAGSLFLISDNASAQYRYRNTCPSVRSVSYTYSTSPYYSYRSYGPGTHISRYAVPPVQASRRSHSISRTTHYRVPVQSHQIYRSHTIPYNHYYNPVPIYNGYNRNGISLRIGF